MRKLTTSLAVLFAVAVTMTARAADFTTRTYPLGVDVEGRYFHSSIYMRLEVKDYNEPFTTFASRDLDPYEAAFAMFIKALQNNDAVSATKLMQGKSKFKDQYSPSQIVSMYRTAFAGMKDVTVVAQVLVGSRHLFVWQANGGMSTIRRAFAVEGTPEQLTVQQVTSNDPVSAVVVNNVMNAMKQRPEAYRSLEARPAKFEYRLPLEGPGTVSMQFAGNSSSTEGVSASSATSPANSAVLALYAQAAEAVQHHDLDGFASKFTAESAATVKEYVAAGGENALAAEWANKRVRLILGSAPVFIVYYTIGDDETSYRHDYVVRDEKSLQLRFANYARQGLLDDVLQRRELFDPQSLAAQQAVTR